MKCAFLLHLLISSQDVVPSIGGCAFSDILQLNEMPAYPPGIDLIH